MVYIYHDNSTIYLLCSVSVDPVTYYTALHTKTRQNTVSKKVLYAYLQAVQKGTRASNHVKLVMMGAEDAGKTSTVSSLLDKKFHQNQETTVGAAVNCCIMDRIKVTEWRQTEMEYQLQELTNLYNVEVHFRKLVTSTFHMIFHNRRKSLNELKRWWIPWRSPIEMCGLLYTWFGRSGNIL